MLTVLTALGPLVLGSGKGPDGVWPIGPRYSLVADKNWDALLLVDFVEGGVAGRLDFLSMPRLVSVATCVTCPFIIAAANGDQWDRRLFRVVLSRPLANSTAPGATLSAGRIEVLPHQLGNPRMMEMTRDGSTCYLSDHERGVVWRFDPRAPAGSTMSVVAKVAKASGLWLTADGAEMLVTTEKDKPGVIRIELPGGRMHALNTKDCQAGNYRQAAYDPYAKGTVLIMVHPDDVGSVLLELSEASGHCAELVGNKKHGSGWLDGVGKEAHFTRLHHFALVPSVGAILASDMDNRALRLVLLSPPQSRGQTRSVLYNEPPEYSSRDTAAPHGVAGMAEGSLEVNGLLPPRSRLPCASLRWRASADGTLCMATLAGGSHEHAHAACARAGARLCHPHELRGPAAALRGAVLASVGGWTWTAHRCASCWMHGPLQCQSGTAKRVRASMLPVTAACSGSPSCDDSAWDSGFTLLGRLGQTICARASTAAAAACCAVGDGQQKPYANYSGNTSVW